MNPTLIHNDLDLTSSEQEALAEQRRRVAETLQASEERRARELEEQSPLIALIHWLFHLGHPRIP